jgi:hypothetical protein
MAALSKRSLNFGALFQINLHGEGRVESSF